MKRAAFVALLLPALASSHPIPGVGDFYAGMLHPLISLDQLLPLLALCLLSAQCGKRTARQAVLLLPLSVIAGALLSYWLPGIPHGTPLPLVATVVLGLLTAFAKPVARIAIAPLTVAVGSWIGLANAFDSGAQVSLLRFTPGVALSVLLCSAYLVAGGGELVARIPAAVRVVGSWLAAAAIMTLALH